MHLDTFASKQPAQPPLRSYTLCCVRYFSQSWKALSSPEIVLCVNAFILFNTNILFYSLYHSPLLSRMFKAFSAILQIHHRPPNFSFLVNSSIKERQFQLAPQITATIYYIPTVHWALCIQYSLTLACQHIFIIPSILQMKKLKFRS